MKMYVIEFIHLVCISLNFKYTSRKAVYRKHTGEVDVIVGAALFIKNNGDAVFDDHFFFVSRGSRYAASPGGEMEAASFN